MFFFLLIVSTVSSLDVIRISEEGAIAQLNVNIGIHSSRAEGVTCWPTLLVLSPAGVPIHVFIGEGHSAFLYEFINTSMQYFKGIPSTNKLIYFPRTNCGCHVNNKELKVSRYNYN